MTARRTTPRRKTERPNTVSGLEAKRAELIRLRERLEADLRAVTCDIDHLEGAILLFDPENTLEAVRGYTQRHRARKGSVRKFIFAALRDATEPITTKTLTDAWCADRGLRTDDTTWSIIRNRFGASLIAMKAQGLVRGVGQVEGYKGWRLA
jgi:hypothetical protein